MYQDIGMANLSGNWKNGHKCSLWDGRGNCETFDLVYYKRQTRSSTDYYKIKLVAHQVRESGLPGDLSGWRCFVTKDGDAEETIGDYPVSKDWQRGRHRVLKLPLSGPSALP